MKISKKSIMATAILGLFNSIGTKAQAASVAMYNTMKDKCICTNMQNHATYILPKKFYDKPITGGPLPNTKYYYPCESYNNGHVYTMTPLTKGEPESGNLQCRDANVFDIRPGIPEYIVS